MLAKLSSLSGLAASLFLAFPALLLYSHYHCFHPWCKSQDALSYVSSSGSVSGQSAFGIPAISNVSTAKGIAVPFGQQYQVLEFSIPSVQVLKRDLTLEAARCKGKNLYQRMKNSYAEYVQDNRKRGREFNLNDVNNGWSVTQHDYYELDPQWDQPFLERITPGQTHDHDPGLSIAMIQNKIFRTDQGRLVRDFQMKAHYSAWYIPAASSIVITYSRSPQFQLQIDYHGQLSPESISRSVPPLNRLSDSIWTIWSANTGANARGLRYLGRDNVVNPDTVSVMKGIFADLHHVEQVPWPGVTASIDSMIGQALLGTPNGVATAWLLIDHHSILGRREPTVTIWTYLDDFDGEITPEEMADGLGNIYMMLWDLGPPLPYN